MRVIDADKLITHELCGSGDVCNCIGLSPKDITDAETVDAIVIPKYATNIDIIRKVFPDYKENLTFTIGWGNQPYKKREE